VVHRIPGKYARQKAVALGVCLALLGSVACGAETATGPESAARAVTAADLDLSTPESRNAVLTKIMGSIGEEEKHAFMRFHIYGFAGDGNVIPFFSMNNYILQRWAPGEDGAYELQHYEVGYYTEFDTDEPIETWENPITGEVIEIDPFILGPVSRYYTPEGILSPGIAPNPLRINVIGDRVFVPAQSIESFPNLFTPEEWPELSNGPEIFWDSMYTFSASLEDVVNPDIKGAPAEIHMQNLVSWQPYLKLGARPGRTMSRAFGTTISGFDELDPHVREAFETYTPEIFETDTWTDVRFDSFDFYNKMVAQRAAEDAE
jgi:Protein of unknown function (DUF1838)